MSISPSAPALNFPSASIESRAPRARAVGTLRQWMEDGTLPAGQPLPAEEELARQVGVSRGTLRSALAMLDEQGLIRSNGGRLRIVAAQAKAATLMEHSIAVLTGYSETPQHRQSGWLEYITQGAMQRIHVAGWHGLTLNPQRLAEGEISRLLADPPAGVLVTDIPLENETMRALIKTSQTRDMKIVVYGDAEELHGFDRVTSDHKSGAYQITRFLIESGRRRILQTATAPATGYWFAPRRAGYEKAMREAGLKPLPTVVTPRFVAQDKNSFEAATRNLAGHLIEHFQGAKTVDAIMASTDADIFGLAAACRLFGQTPNKDVAIAGYDNYWAEWPLREFEPSSPVATVDKCNAVIGQELVALLLDRIDGRLPQAPQRRVVAPEIVVTPVA